MYINRDILWTLRRLSKLWSVMIDIARARIRLSALNAVGTNQLSFKGTEHQTPLDSCWKNCSRQTTIFAKHVFSILWKSEIFLWKTLVLLLIWPSIVKNKGFWVTHLSKERFCRKQRFQTGIFNAFQLCWRNHYVLIKVRSYDGTNVTMKRWYL